MLKKFYKVVALILITCFTFTFSACDATSFYAFLEETFGIVIETGKPPAPPVVPIETGELSIHFMELGNDYAGDCTLIDIGDVEVLVDAGSRTNSADTIVPYINKYCTDGKLEYVIATHAHRDHIAAFVDDSNTKHIFKFCV